MVDAGGGGQRIDDIFTWWQQILASDPQHNVVFDIHLYGNTATEEDSQIVGTYNGRNPFDLNTELQKAVAENIPLVVGEFSWDPEQSQHHLLDATGDADLPELEPRLARLVLESERRSDFQHARQRGLPV